MYPCICSNAPWPATLLTLLTLHNIDRNDLTIFDSLDIEMARWNGPELDVAGRSITRWAGHRCFLAPHLQPRRCRQQTIREESSGCIRSCISSTSMIDADMFQSRFSKLFEKAAFDYPMSETGAGKWENDHLFGALAVNPNWNDHSSGDWFDAFRFGSQNQKATWKCHSLGEPKSPNSL